MSTATVSCDRSCLGGRRCAVFGLRGIAPLSSKSPARAPFPSLRAARRTRVCAPAARVVGWPPGGRSVKIALVLPCRRRSPRLRRRHLRRLQQLARQAGRLLAPPADGAGFQISMQMDAPAAGETWQCVVMNMPNLDVANINRVEPVQTPGLHHLDVTALISANIDPGRYDCGPLYAAHPELMDQADALRRAGHRHSHDRSRPRRRRQGPARPAGPVRAPLRERHHAGRPRRVLRQRLHHRRATTCHQPIYGMRRPRPPHHRPRHGDHTEWTRCVMDHDVDLVLVSTHTHALGRDTHIKLFDGTNVGDEIYVNTAWQAPPLEQFTPTLPHCRRHRLRNRLPLLQRHRRRGRLGLLRQGRDVQPGPGLDPGRRQRHLQAGRNFRRHSRPLAHSPREFLRTKVRTGSMGMLMRVWSSVWFRRLGIAALSGRRARLGAVSPLRLVGARSLHAPERERDALHETNLKLHAKTSACAASSRRSATTKATFRAPPSSAPPATSSASSSRGEVVYQVDEHRASGGDALMLLGFKLRRLLWRARRVTVDLWGAATTVGAAALVGAGWFPDLRASTGRRRARSSPPARSAPWSSSRSRRGCAPCRHRARARHRRRGSARSQARPRARRRARRRHLRDAAALGRPGLADLSAGLRAGRLPRDLPPPHGRRAARRRHRSALEALLFAPRSTADARAARARAGALAR